MNPVLTKTDFTLRYKRGEFGNTSPTWLTCGELLRWARERYPAAPGVHQPVPGLFHLRSRIPAGPTHYNLKWSEVVSKWLRVGDPQNWYCSAMAPEDKKTLNGELVVLPGELWLTYSPLPLPMREAFAQDQRHCRNSAALAILRHVMCPNSYDWLQHLLDEFSSDDQTLNHAIEFSTYSCQWGTLYPLFNTCWWEVRRY